MSYINEPETFHVQSSKMLEEIEHRVNRIGHPSASSKQAKKPNQSVSAINVRSCSSLIILEENSHSKSGIQVFWIN